MLLCSELKLILHQENEIKKLKSLLHSLLKKISLVLRASFSTFQLAILLSFKGSPSKKCKIISRWFWLKQTKSHELCQCLVSGMAEGGGLARKKELLLLRYSHWPN